MDEGMDSSARKEASRLLGREMDKAEWNSAYPAAAEKLRRILTREGDAGGVRLQAWYLGQLVFEAVVASEASRACRERAQKKKAASEEDSQPASTLYVIAPQKVNRGKRA